MPTMTISTGSTKPSGKLGAGDPAILADQPDEPGLFADIDAARDDGFPRTMLDGRGGGDALEDTVGHLDDA